MGCLPAPGLALRPQAPVCLRHSSCWNQQFSVMSPTSHIFDSFSPLVNKFFSCFTFEYLSEVFLCPASSSPFSLFYIYFPSPHLSFLRSSALTEFFFYTFFSLDFLFIFSFLCCSRSFCLGFCLVFYLSMEPSASIFITTKIY